MPDMYSSAYNFMMYFDGSKQPVMHDYPWTFVVPGTAIVLYLIMVFGLQRWMRDRQPLEFPILLRLWNLFMTILAFTMLTGLAVPILINIYKNYLPLSLNTIYMVTCSPDYKIWIGPQVFWGWIFAWSKFVEMGDTLFLILRKKPVIFLHWYHHTTVLAYTWFSISVMNPTSGFFASVNAFVHVWLYYYYYIADRGYRPFWGRYLTLAQLIQMVFGFGVSLLWAYYYFSGAVCPQKYPLTLVGCTMALYGSYFFLFFVMYMQRWGESTERKKQHKKEGESRKKID